MSIRHLHTMVRVKNIDESLKFYCDGLGLNEVARLDFEKGRFTLVFLAAPEDADGKDFSKTPLVPGAAAVELTYNWDEGEDYDDGRNFGHMAYEVDDIYEIVERLSALGVTINRPPRDGRMAFVRSPDGISIELLQRGEALAERAPWKDAENIGEW